MKRISLVSNNDNDIRPANINKYRLTNPNLTSLNRQLRELSWNFQEVIFYKLQFLIGIQVLYTRYEYSESQNYNLFSFFNH